MYRSGISSFSIRTLDKDDDKRKSLRSGNGQALSGGALDAKQPVHWRDLAQALVEEEQALILPCAEGGKVAAASKSSKSRPATASALNPTPGSRRMFRDWLEREGVAVAGSENCKTMKFSSEYYATLSRIIELQVKLLPLSSDQVVAAVKLIWAHAPAVNRCLHAALQLEAASSGRTETDSVPFMARESCVELIACCLKWIQYVRKIDAAAPTSALRRSVIAVCDSIFIELQPAIWRVAQPVGSLRHLRLLEVERPPPGTLGKLDATDLVEAVQDEDGAEARSGHPPRGAAQLQASRISHGHIAETGGTYVFRNDILVQKHLSADGLPSWLEQCSDDHLVEAACSCPTFFEVCQQFAKQEQHDRERCAKTISQIHNVQEKVAVLCREDDAAVRHALELDWEKSNLCRSIQLMRDDLTSKQAQFDADLDDMIRRQNELLKQVQEVREILAAAFPQQIHRAKTTRGKPHTSHVIFHRPNSDSNVCAACKSTARASPLRSSQ